MATSSIQVSAGTGTYVATNSISEDAVTKNINRSVLNNSSGTEIGNATTPVQVSLANTAANATAVKVDNSGVTQPVKGAGTAGTADTGVVTVQGIASMTPVFTAGNIASGTSDSGNPVEIGGQARTTELTAVSSAQRVLAVFDKVGKQIVLPFSNPENFISGTNTSTGTSGVSVIAAQGAGVKIYVTGIFCANTGSTTSLITIQQDPAGSPTTLAYTINPNGGGSNLVFNPPLVVAANKAVGFTPGSASTTQYVTITGYTGA